ncbi:hypothetical protein N0V90_006623 [Kalmusia sp. IMI 367209]|nr:hypothetical protein N0V90_006623 [Kalmusia sp. IMI 367209]
MSSSQHDELLTSLQISARNALATFGPASPQYVGIKYVVDEHMAKAALHSLSLASRTKDEEQRGGGEANVSGHVMNLAFRPKGA